MRLQYFAAQVGTSWNSWYSTMRRCQTYTTLQIITQHRDMSAHINFYQCNKWSVEKKQHANRFLYFLLFPIPFQSIHFNHRAPCTHTHTHEHRYTTMLPAHYKRKKNWTIFVEIVPALQKKKHNQRRSKKCILPRQTRHVHGLSIVQKCDECVAHRVQ